MTNCENFGIPFCWLLMLAVIIRIRLKLRMFVFVVEGVFVSGMGDFTENGFDTMPYKFVNLISIISI